MCLFPRIEESVPEATAAELTELIDRYARAIDGLGGSVKLECKDLTSGEMGVEGGRDGVVG